MSHSQIVRLNKVLFRGSVFVLIIFIAGCKSVTKTSLPISAIPSVKSEPSVGASVISAASSPNPSSQAPASPTKYLSSSTPTSCPLIQNTMSRTFLTNGTIIFYPLDKHRPEKFTSGMDAPIDFLKQLPDSLYLPSSDESLVSIDRKWLALINERSKLSDSGVIDYLVITNGDEQSSIFIPRGDTWLDIYRWLNSTQLLLIPSNIKKEGTLISFNPFTQSSHVISPAFPNLLSDGDGYRPSGWLDAPGRPLYDPSLTRVVYYSYELKSENSRSVVLWNLEAGKEIWRKKFTSPGIPEDEVTQPKWSPDGKQFALFVISDGENSPLDFLMVDRDGKETKVAIPDLPQPLYFAGSLSWSPNSQYIAFFVEDNLLEMRLLILDLATQKIWDPCITDPIGVPAGEVRAFSRLPVVWSPDSHQFIVSRGGDLTPSNDLVVDVEKQEISRLGFGFHAAAWLAPYENKQ
jgi:hypothetical protein